MFFPQEHGCPEIFSSLLFHFLGIQTSKNIYKSHFPSRSATNALVFFCIVINTLCQVFTLDLSFPTTPTFISTRKRNPDQKNTKCKRKKNEKIKY